MKIGNREFNLDKTYIMGILNITPDSFSDGMKFFNEKSALEQAEKLIKDEADIIDIGFESTNPNSKPLSKNEELERLKIIGKPIIKYIKSFDIPISIDTYKSEVATVALDYGVAMVNDIWGFKYDPKMAEVCRAYNVVCCLMHNRKNENYKNFMMEVISDIRESVEIALNGGVNKKKIIIDPGIGFSKSRDNDVNILKNLKALKTLGYPILLGASKKRVIGHIIGDQNCNEETKSIGTLAVSTLATLASCFIVRVHNVKENKIVRDIMEKLC